MPTAHRMMAPRGPTKLIDAIGLESFVSETAIFKSNDNDVEEQNRRRPETARKLGRAEITQRAPAQRNFLCLPLSPTSCSPSGVYLGVACDLDPVWDQVCWNFPESCSCPLPPSLGVKRLQEQTVSGLTREQERCQKVPINDPKRKSSSMRKVVDLTKEERNI